ncbi:hypothetical protein [Methylobacterium symbioticum]|uniref:Uncharacterized protein n=1 Tax=Methylobacterium symbioticum TaxID=2584084 RepID=A0A509EEW2_9HYPH|nr:hypothetical protein [Methylobacterium symbioticum]VUD72680.1 hypothetical protein MET9862_03280 [Methylobacterium symbioticum]
MPQSFDGVQGRSVPEKPLHQLVAEAVQSHATPISQLLRLMGRVNAEGGANEGLRAQLRARIGAPLQA